MITDLYVGDHINIRCSRKIFHWMNSDGFDGQIRDRDHETGVLQWIKISVRTEPAPSRFETHTFWLNILSSDVTAIEKLR